MTLYRKKAFEYDARGNPSKETFYLDPKSNKSLSITRTFYSNGNLATITDTDSITKTITYDPSGLFPIEEIVQPLNGPQLTTVRKFNRLTGEVSHETNPQKVGKSTGFDDFGRPLEEYIHPVSGSKQSIRSYTYEYIDKTVNDWDNITLLKTTIVEPQPGYPNNPTKITYTDASGQVLQSCGRSERDNYRLIQFRIRNGGREEIQTEPVFSKNCDFLPTIAQNARVLRRWKDLFGRVTLIDPPAGELNSPVGQVAISYQTDPQDRLKKTITNPKQQVRVEFYDLNGRLVEVHDALGSVMQYAYNAIGDLKTVTAQGVEVTKLNYDMLGRKTNMFDADMGQWSYYYDAYGRLAKQVDAKGQKIEYSYDGLGRIKQKDTIGTGNKLAKYEAYTYDSGAAGYDVDSGELFQVTEFDAQKKLLRRTRYGYDADYRRTAKISRLIPGIGEFTQKLSHDYRGRVTETMYPGGHKLRYRYMLNGNLQQLCGNSCDSQGGEKYYTVDPQNGYDVFGSLLSEKYGNGVVSDYAYYPLSRRLYAKKTHHDSGVYSHRTYTHDALSNIQKINDFQNPSGTGGLNLAKYDSLNRLTSYQHKGSSTTHTMEYDLRGNIKKNPATYGNLEYKYESAGHRHAVSAVGQDKFYYDANGNMVQDPHRKMGYNAQNQLAHVEMKNGVVVDYDYDYTGARVSKTVTREDVYHRIQQATTHYLGDAVEIRGDKVILNLYAGQRRIATRTLGSVKDVLNAGSGLIDVGIHPSFRPTMLMPLVLLLIALFILASLRRVPLWLPRWAHQSTAPPQGVMAYVRVLLLKLYREWCFYQQSIQETLAGFSERAAAKALLVLIISLVVIQPPTLALAGESGEPKSPTSDADYLYYHHDDHLGSSHILTEGKEKTYHSGIIYKRGELLQRFEYSPFGQERFVLNPNLKFDPSYTGQLYDVETGLYFYKSRYYNPMLGRFIQPDTVVPDAKNLQAYNRYSYVANNPLKFVDPTGHFWFGFFIAIAIGALVGAATSAIFGGNILFGALQGIITAAAFFSAGSLIEAMRVSSLLIKVGIHAAAGAVAGALNSTVSGGGLSSIGRGAAIGGLSGGFSKYAGKFLKDADFMVRLLGRSLVGAATGTVATAIWGGNVLKGLGMGAAYAGASFVFNDMLHKGAKHLKNRQERKMLEALDIENRFEAKHRASKYYRWRVRLRSGLRTISKGAITLGGLAYVFPSIGSPFILVGAGVVGLGASYIDSFLDFDSKVSQGNFRGAAGIIHDDLLGAPGTGLDPL